MTDDLLYPFAVGFRSQELRPSASSPPPGRPQKLRAALFAGPSPSPRPAPPAAAPRRSPHRPARRRRPPPRGPGSSPRAPKARPAPAPTPWPAETFARFALATGPGCRRGSPPSAPPRSAQLRPKAEAPHAKGAGSPIPQHHLKSREHHQNPERKATKTLVKSYTGNAGPPVNPAPERDRTPPVRTVAKPAFWCFTPYASKPTAPVSARAFQRMLLTPGKTSTPTKEHVLLTPLFRASAARCLEANEPEKKTFREGKHPTPRARFSLAHGFWWRN